MQKDEKVERNMIIFVNCPRTIDGYCKHPDAIGPLLTTSNTSVFKFQMCRVQLLIQVQ